MPLDWQFFYDEEHGGSRQVAELERGGILEIHSIPGENSGAMRFRACYELSDGTHVPIGEIFTRTEAMRMAEDFAAAMGWE